MTKEFRCQTDWIQNIKSIEHTEKSIMDNIKYAYDHIKRNLGDRKTKVPTLNENEFMVQYEDMYIAVEMQIYLYDIVFLIRIEYE